MSNKNVKFPMVVDLTTFDCSPKVIVRGIKNKNKTNIATHIRPLIIKGSLIFDQIWPSEVRGPFFSKKKINMGWIR